jgi:hypothetical protein
MSHVVNIDFTIKDLAALEHACKSLGMELVRDQKTFKWFGRHVGDYPLPAGFKAEDMGKCDHALRVKGNPNAYEIGLVQRRDGVPGFTLMYDFFVGGKGLEAKVGKGCQKLRQEYAASVSTLQASRMGLRAHRTVEQDGSIRITLSR